MSCDLVWQHMGMGFVNIVVFMSLPNSLQVVQISKYPGLIFMTGSFRLSPFLCMPIHFFIENCMLPEGDFKRRLLNKVMQLSQLAAKNSVRRDL